MGVCVMTTHIMSFTYAPKIEAVRSGECRQTIRKVRGNRRIKEGDFIIFHGWSGKPYRSPWSWRLKVKVTEVLGFEAFPEGVRLPNGYIEGWGYMKEYAELDHISPPTGEALKETLKKLNGPDWGGYYNIIRWEVVG
ncbi:MAG: hypothetical protein J7L32_05380 [Thermoplasmata archaeon]|nr:hypothetical protein [Thermoplasmata archaeon]